MTPSKLADAAEISPAPANFGGVDLDCGPGIHGVPAPYGVADA